MTDTPKPARLCFVYNADSGLFNTMADIGHKIFSPQTYSCQLCALTHGYFRERDAWRRFVETLPVKCEFLHRDEFRERYPDVADPLPAVFRLDAAGPAVCLDADTLQKINDIDSLEKEIKARCLQTEGPV
jgi:hypothetical protein